MKKSIFILLIISLLLSPLSLFALDSIPEYEMLVIENLPENMSLDMNIKEIIDAKHSSQMAKNKKRIYNVLVKNLSPLLSGLSFSKGYNLVELASQIPLNNITDSLIEIESEASAPSDFMILILPKKPTSVVNSTAPLPYAPLYSTRKASIITTASKGDALRKSFSEQINGRLQEAIDYVYQVQLNKKHTPSTFFVGALGHIHLEKGATAVKLQLAGGLPTHQSMVFDQLETEVHLQSFNYPNPPEYNFGKTKLNNHPGAIVELIYKQDRETLVKGKIRFGSLGLLEGTSWITRDQLPPFDEFTLSTDAAAISQFSHSYNVPHLRGEILYPLGNGIVDIELFDKKFRMRPPTLQNFVNSWLARDYDIQLNVHEIELDMSQLKINDMRITLQLNIKDNVWFGAIPMPILELPSINEKFRVAGNDMLGPIQAELEYVKSLSLVDLLKNPKVQMELYMHINQLLKTQGGL